MSSLPFSRRLLRISLVCFLAPTVSLVAAPPAKPNILLVVADDLNADSVGAFGCPVKDTTPRMDKFAKEGVIFRRAHVTVGVCQPSRAAILTGRYPVRSGGEGFFYLRKPGVPLLPQVLREGGYRVGIMGKNGHSTPYKNFEWDFRDPGDEGRGRNPAIYREKIGRFIDETREAGKPFFVMANSHDPHRPFFGNDPKEWYEPGSSAPPARPSRIFTSADVAVPGFLPDLPQVRKEVAEYFCSVRRFDDTLGELLDMLAERGLAESTLVVVLSDNGMPFPFSKANAYMQSTRTPLVMRWPGRVAPGSVDEEHFVSGIDLMPTLLDAAGLAAPSGMDGATLGPLLSGSKQQGRSHVFTQFYATSGGRNYPMFAVQDSDWLYIFNPWSNGKREFRVESQWGRTWAALETAARSNRETEERVRFFRFRTVEELYNVANDPSALRNLASDSVHAERRDSMRHILAGWMDQVGEKAAAALSDSKSAKAREAYMEFLKRELPARQSRE